MSFTTIEENIRAKTMYEITMSKDWNKNYSSKPIVDGEVCIVCGKLIKDVNRKHSVRVFWGVTAVTEAEANEIIAKEGYGGDLSYYPVGSDCLRKQPELKPYVEDAAKANARFTDKEFEEGLEFVNTLADQLEKLIDEDGFVISPKDNNQKANNTRISEETENGVSQQFKDTVANIIKEHKPVLDELAKDD